MMRLFLTLFFHLIVFCGMIGCNFNSSKKTDTQALYSDSEDSSNLKNESEINKEIEKIPGLDFSEGLREVGTLSAFKGEGKIYTSLDEALAEPDKVYRLKLNSRRLTHLPTQISLFSNLQELYLSDNQLSFLPDSFAVKLPKLQVLDLCSNSFRNLPEQITELKNLQSLHISSNGITSLPTKFEQLKNLQILDLADNPFRAIPKEVFALDNLKYLFIKGIPLKTLPTEISQLKQLTRLSLEACQLKQFPPEVLNMRGLERLVLANNQIAEIPPEIANLKKLVFLNLSKNKINNGLEYIRPLKKLLNLNVSDNPLTAFAADIFTQLPVLKALDLSNTIVSNLAGIGKSAELIWLNINGTKITQLVDEIVACKKLQFISLGNNPQLDLNTAFESLSKLPRLNFVRLVNIAGKRVLIDLPASIASLKKLKYLDLKNNLLKNPSAEMDKLAQIPQLAALNLSLCGIKRAMSEFEKLTSLQKLGLDIQNMLRSEVQKLPELLPNTLILDGSEHFDYRIQ